MAYHSPPVPSDLGASKNTVTFRSFHNAAVSNSHVLNIIVNVPIKVSKVSVIGTAGDSSMCASVMGIMMMIYMAIPST